MQSSVPTESIRAAVVQDGARLHYAVPVALQRAGCLRLMFTDWFIARDSSVSRFNLLLSRLGSRKMGGLLERRCDEIPPQAVRINPMLALRQRLERRHHLTEQAFYKWASYATGSWIRHAGLADCNTLFGFVRNIDPNLCRWAHDGGLLTVGDQIIAPARIEEEEARYQMSRYPDWEPAESKFDYDLVAGVEEATWKHLDRITCGSEYVREGLRKQGIDENRIHVAPYPIDAGHFLPPDRKGRQKPLVVGFCGAVNLRKGAPYFFEVARRLAGANLKFVMIGPVQLRDSVIRSFGQHVEIVGRVPRSEVARWLSKFDIFLFPSTCEGSAGSAMEAMASGLPIVASPNSGTIVRERIDGFIRPYNDIDALAESVERLAGDENLRLEMGRRARRRAEEMNIEHYGNQLLKIIGSLVPVRGDRGNE